MNAKQREKMNEEIRRHGENLLEIWPDIKERDPIALCRKLHRLETKARQLSTAYCNGEVQMETAHRKGREILKEVAKIVGKRPPPVHLNWDACGCALKIDSAHMKGVRLYGDMGGNGLIAPTFDSE